MKTKYVFFSVLFLAVSCSIDDRPTGNNQKNGITFTVSSGYSASPRTRAVYSGDRNNAGTGSSFYERINWTDGDQIAVRCDESAGVYTSAPSNPSILPDPSIKQWLYTITAATSHSGKVDQAGSVDAVGNLGGLQWGAATEHRIWGLYPSSMEYVSLTADPGDDTQSQQKMRAALKVIEGEYQGHYEFCDPEGRYAVYNHLGRERQSTTFANDYFNSLFFAQANAMNQALAYFQVEKDQKVTAVKDGKQVTTINSGTHVVTEYEPGVIPMAAAATAEKEDPITLSFEPLVTALRIELQAATDFQGKKLTLLELVHPPISAEPASNPYFTPDGYQMDLCGHVFTAFGDLDNAGNTKIYGSFPVPAAVFPSGIQQAPEVDPQSIFRNDMEYSVRIIPDGTHFPNTGIVLPTAPATTADPYKPAAFTFMLTPYSHSCLYLRLTFGGVFNPAENKVIDDPANPGNKKIVRSLALGFRDQDRGLVALTLAARKKTFIDRITVPAPEDDAAWEDLTLMQVLPGTIVWK